MFDTVQSAGFHTSHDRPCVECGHAMHTYLACSDTCACVPPQVAVVRTSLVA